MRLRSSAMLNAFYREYLVWIECGSCEDHEIFQRKYGLCHNLLDWVNTNLPGGNQYNILLKEMQDQFEQVGLDWRYPFNDGEHSYRAGLREQTHHQNAKRISWVVARIGDGVHANEN